MHDRHATLLNCYKYIYIVSVYFYIRANIYYIYIYLFISFFLFPVLSKEGTNRIAYTLITLGMIYDFVTVTVSSIYRFL